MAGLFFSSLDFGNVSEMNLQFGDHVEELVVVVPDSDQCGDPVAQGARGFQEATAVVLLGQAASSLRCPAVLVFGPSFISDVASRRSAAKCFES